MWNSHKAIFLGIEYVLGDLRPFFKIRFFKPFWLFLTFYYYKKIKISKSVKPTSGFKDSMNVLSIGVTICFTIFSISTYVLVDLFGSTA